MNKYENPLTSDRIFQLNRMELCTDISQLFDIPKNVECPISLCKFQMNCSGRLKRALDDELFSYFMGLREFAWRTERQRRRVNESDKIRNIICDEAYARNGRCSEA